MNAFAVTFVILPCLAACVTAAIVRDWRLAAAALFGALGVIISRGALPVGAGTFALPVLFGIVLGAAGVVAALLWRPTLDVWGRMLAALGLTFIVSVGHLLIILTGF